MNMHSVIYKRDQLKFIVYFVIVVYNKCFNLQNIFIIINEYLDELSIVNIVDVLIRSQKHISNWKKHIPIVNSLDVIFEQPL